MSHDTDETGAGYGAGVAPIMKAGRDQSSTISNLATRVAIAERQVREIAVDRDKWKKRCHEMEAELMSLGGLEPMP